MQITRMQKEFVKSSKKMVNNATFKLIHCCLLMNLTTFGKCNLKDTGLPVHPFSGPGLAWQAALKKIEVNLDQLTDVDIFLIAQKHQRWNMSWFYQYAKASNKYMKDYGENKESSYLK